MSTDFCRWIFLLFFLITWTKYSDSKDIRVVCYYTNWSVYRPGTAKFSPQNINPYLCTHLIYAFGGFTKENTLKPFDKYQDIEKGGYAKFTGLKTYNKNLKTMLAIGGWNEGSSRFSPMVANPERRKELVKNAIRFLRQNHFDGLDLDWEYPSFRDGGKSRDRDNYAHLVQELREEFERESEKTGRPRLLLTMAVPAGIEYINKGYDVPKLTEYLDWMNILSYDYHSAFEPAVNHHAPLYSLEEPSEYNYDTELNIDYTIKHYLEKGADPNKLVLGIPTYGRSYTLFNPDANEIGAPADGPGDMGEATRENGYLAYYEICEYIKTQDWEVVQPNPDAMGPYAYKDNQWVGYDDDAIARRKAAYVAENKLGGIMFWSIDNDDFRGNCHGKPYPIIEAAKEALISAYGLTDENLVAPTSKPIKSKTRTRPTSKSFGDKNENSNKNSGRRNRVKIKSERTDINSRAKIRRTESRRTTTEGTIHSSLELVTPSYTTPAPPATPDMGGVFKCEDEGFYPHPKDCKKYYWCLSGPGELGIIAHQFTCPAGLYFNKAADSCDYTRNVLCNKKLSKATTTTTTAATTSKTPVTSTSRVPLKITAATSRTTVFRTTSTTEAYEDEYEYEDEEEDEEENKNSEEDPKVIKELLDLIKKAGGIEELEKQLKINDDGTALVSHPDATTPSSISKSLVERVLGKAAKNKNTGKKNSYSFLNRNSRGPQNEGIETTEDKEKPEKGRPQYTTITRQRAPKVEQGEDEPEKEEENSRTYIKKQPEYVNIRRERVSSTTKEPENSKGQVYRNKILGEEDDEDDTYTPVDTNGEDNKQPTRKKPSTPQYVNIRRQRPSTTEETSTSKYTVIRRGTTTEANTDEELFDLEKRGTATPSSSDKTSKGKRRGTTIASNVESSLTEKNDAKYKYKILRRGSTTEPSVDESGSTISSKRRGTTVQNISEKRRTSADSPIEEKYQTLKRGSTTESSTVEKFADESTTKHSPSSNISSTTPETETKFTIISDTENSVTDVDQLLVTSPETLDFKTIESVNSTNLPLDQPTISSTDPSGSTGEVVYQTKTPQLLEPRPFSISTNGPTSTSTNPVTESSTRTTKVSESNYKLRVRQKVPNTQTDTISTTTLTTEKPTPFRAPSRYKQTTPSQLDQQTTRPNIRPLIRARKRFSTTTERYVENYEDDLNRTFRPSELADLSSLTAVDFTSLKELNRFGNPRQRRPRPSTTIKTTTQKPEETLKTSSRTLPLARKLLNGTTFGKTRRVISNKNEPEIDDQINSGSDTTHKIRPFTRAPSISGVVSTTEETTRQTLRNKKIIRRLRPTTRSRTQSPDLNDGNNQVVFKKRLVRPSASLATDTENLIEKASSNSLSSRRFTRPTTTTTIAEKVNKLTITTETSHQTSTELSPDEEEQNETLDDVSIEEGENIKLSESNIRENSNVNNNNNVVNADDGKKIRKKVLKRIKSKIDDEKVTTEPNIIIRTRKIIRKLRPTEAAITTTPTTEVPKSSTQGRRRKIIRRLRPITTSSSATKTSTEKTLFIRGRPYLVHSNTEKSADNEQFEDTELPFVKNSKELEATDVRKSEVVKFRPNPVKSKYKSTSRTATLHSDLDNEQQEDEFADNSKEDVSLNLEKNRYKSFRKTTTKSPDADISIYSAIDRSKYGTLNRGTTSTTQKYESDTADDEDELGVESQEDDGSTSKYEILNSALSASDDNETITEDAIKIRILRPSVEEKNKEIENKSIDSNDATTTAELNLLNQTTEIYNETRDSENEEHSNSTQSTDVHILDRDNNESVEAIKNDNSDEDRQDNNDEETLITTVRNYINPILTRQKSRPAFVRPKLTTQTPLRTSTASKPKYRAFSRGSTPRPSKIHVVTEEVLDDEHREVERKFIPKSRFSVIERENKTEKPTERSSEEVTEPNTNSKKFMYNTTDMINVQISTTTSESNMATELEEISTVKTTKEIEANNDTIDEANVNTESLTSTESITENPTTYEYINISHFLNPKNTTVSPEKNDATEEFDNVINTTENYNMTTDEARIPEITTLPQIDFITIKNIFEEVISETTLNNNDTTTVSTTGTTGTTSHLHSQNTLAEHHFDETTPDYIDTSTVTIQNTTTETTPIYQPKSTLRSLLNRPKYTGPKRISESSTISARVRPSRRFNQKNRGQSTKPRLVTPNLKPTAPTAPLKNAFAKYSTTERSRFVTKERDEEPEVKDYDDNDDTINDTTDDEKDVDAEIEQVYTPGTFTTSRHRLNKFKPIISNRPDGYLLKRTTETPKVTEDLSDIDTEAVRSRNKNLFAKKRKMNTPFAGYDQNHSTSLDENTMLTTERRTASSFLTTTPAIFESVTKPTQAFETTEYLTTLQHVFAETELNTDKSSAVTETITASLPESGTNSTKAKVEKLIEVNRIVEVHEMNNTDAEKDKKVIDKVGVINRVTIVKVVDGNVSLKENEIIANGTPLLQKTLDGGDFKNVASEIVTINPFEQPSERQDRKYEIYGASKVFDYNNKDTNRAKGAEIIDGISMINVITPRPYYSTEASTISLEALFQTQDTQKSSNINANPPKLSNDDELLETDNSRYINVRVLGQDKSQNSPIRVPKEDDYITMKAEVVEVTPKIDKDVIKIVPIHVEMSRKLIFPSDFNLKVENGVPKVDFEIIKTENK